MPPSDGAPASQPRYCSVKILDKCPHCGGGLPMNGPLLEVRCSSCQKSTRLKERYWKHVLEDPDNDFDEGGGSHTLNFETQVTWRAEMPACTKCGASLPVEAITVGYNVDIPCSSCGHGNSTYPAEAWLTAQLPSTRQLYCAQRPGEPSPGSSLPEASRPIVLSCPQCSGSLSVSSESERTVPCEYCGASVYLPDDLWRQLHPVKTTEKWYVRYEGRNQRALEAQERLRKEAREAEERQRDIEAQFQVQQEIDRAQNKRNLTIWIVVALAVAGLSGAIMLLSTM